MGHRFNGAFFDSLSPQWSDISFSQDDSSYLFQETQRLRAAALVWINSTRLKHYDHSHSDSPSTLIPIITGDLVFEKYLSYEAGGRNPVRTAVEAASHYLETPIKVYIVKDTNYCGDCTRCIEVLSVGEEFTGSYATQEHVSARTIHLVYDDVEMIYKVAIPNAINGFKL